MTRRTLDSDNVPHVHDQRFDGDDPYLICSGCGARWDALTGKPFEPVVLPASPAPLIGFDPIGMTWDNGWHCAGCDGHDARSSNVR